MRSSHQSFGRGFSGFLLGSLALTALLSTTSGCTTGVSLGQHDGGRPTPCGRTECPLGEVCCSESCGVCVPEGAACLMRECGGPCDPFLALGSGTCRTALGFAWTGADCALVAGCACEGIDCERLYASGDECRSAHAGCVPPDTCLSSADCSDGSYCDFPMGGCGAPSGLVGTCMLLPVATACPAVFDPVCGCDGLTYDSACEAAIRGVSVSFPGPCDACAPDDATGVGGCDAILGRVWNGMGCVDLTGCSCVGADCPTSGPMAPPCERLHESCLVPDFPCGDTYCYRSSEYCVVDPTTTARCAASPGCSPVSCACVVEMGMCSDDGIGGVTVVL